VRLLFQRAIGVQLTEVPFQGTGAGDERLLGGQVDVLCDQTTQTVPQIKAGSVKLYGMTTRNRVKVLPSTPTLAEQGLKDFEVVVWHGIYAPKGTPKPIIDRMNCRGAHGAEGPRRDQAHGRPGRRDRARTRPTRRKRCTPG
jgi:tripartite-type tricarboxylate transporter receptor subunit TctC